jgi:hypothetical protein
MFNKYAISATLALLLTTTGCYDPIYGDKGGEDTATDTAGESTLAQAWLIEGHWWWQGTASGDGGQVWAYGEDESELVWDEESLYLYGQDSGSLQVDYEIVKGTAVEITCPDDGNNWSLCLYVQAE